MLFKLPNEFDTISPNLRSPRKLAHCSAPGTKDRPHYKQRDFECSLTMLRTKQNNNAEDKMEPIPLRTGNVKFHIGQ
jgi:hypothetical protein